MSLVRQRHRQSARAWLSDPESNDLDHWVATGEHGEAELVLRSVSAHDFACALAEAEERGRALAGPFDPRKAGGR